MVGNVLHDFWGAILKDYVASPLSSSCGLPIILKLLYCRDSTSHGENRMGSWSSVLPEPDFQAPLLPRSDTRNVSERDSSRFQATLSQLKSPKFSQLSILSPLEFLTSVMEFRTWHLSHFSSVWWTTNNSEDYVRVSFFPMHGALGTRAQSC